MQYIFNFSFYIERVYISYTIYNPFKFPTIHLSLITIDYIINYINEVCSC